MGIELKSTAALMDELFTTLLKCWHHQEVVMRSEDSETIARAAKLAQSTNDRRNQLMIAIDHRLGEGYSAALIKSYTHGAISERMNDAERIERLESLLDRLSYAVLHPVDGRIVRSLADEAKILLGKVEA